VLAVILELDGHAETGETGADDQVVDGVGNLRAHAFDRTGVIEHSSIRWVA
jgi:hypothetical protein